MSKTTLIRGRTRFQDARAFIEQRGILPERDGYTTRQLANELSRQGWRWEIAPERAEATKVSPVFLKERHTVIAEGTDPIVNLAIVLADAIRFDEERGLTPLPPFLPSIIARTANGTIIAVIEVKNRANLTPELAAFFRLNRWRFGLRSLHSPFFMLVSQEFGYLWDQRDGPRPDAPPTMTFSMRPIIERYARWLEPDERLGGPQLELIVAGWLNDLADVHTEPAQPPLSAFAGTEFLDYLRDTTVRLAVGA